jgi:hypothetical protein
VAILDLQRREMESGRILAAPDGLHVSESGVVYGRRGKPLKPRFTRTGYARVSADGDHLIHRLVWIAFNGPIQPGLEINHINGLKDDNRLENLELVTRSENLKHAYRIGLKHRPPGIAKLSEDEVRAIRSAYRPGVVKMSDLASRYGVSKSSISRIVNKRYWAGVV